MSYKWNACLTSQKNINEEINGCRAQRGVLEYESPFGSMPTTPLPAWEKVGIFYSCYQEVFFLSRYAPAFDFSNGWTRWGFEKKHSNSNILIWHFEVVYTSSTTVYAWGSEASVLLFSKKSPWYSSPFLSLSSQVSFSFSISFSLSFLLHVAAWVLE